MTTIELLTARPELQDFLNLLKAKGYKFDLINKISKTGDTYDDIFQLGINTYDAIWSWFEIFLGKEDMFCTFSHKYSMNTGKTKKGIRTGSKVVVELHRQLGITDGNGYDLMPTVYPIKNNKICKKCSEYYCDTDEEILCTHL